MPISNENQMRKCDGTVVLSDNIPVLFSRLPAPHGTFLQPPEGEFGQRSKQGTLAGDHFVSQTAGWIGHFLHEACVRR